jgi:hypothetical protein
VGNKIREDLFDVHIRRVWANTDPDILSQSIKFLGNIGKVGYAVSCYDGENNVDGSISIIKFDINSGLIFSKQTYVCGIYDLTGIRQHIITDTHILLYCGYGLFIRYKLTNSSIDIVTLDSDYEYILYENHPSTIKGEVLYALKVKNTGDVYESNIVKILYTSNTGSFTEIYSRDIGEERITSLCYTIDSVNDLTTLYVSSESKILKLTDKFSLYSFNERLSFVINNPEIVCDNAYNIKRMLMDNISTDTLYANTDNMVYYIKYRQDEPNNCIANSISLNEGICKTMLTSNSEFVILSASSDGTAHIRKYSSSLTTMLYNAISTGSSIISDKRLIFETEDGYISIISTVSAFYFRHNYIDNISEACRQIESDRTHWQSFLNADGWDNGRYDLSTEFPGTLYDIEISLTSDITEEQYDAFADAKILPYYSTGTNAEIYKNDIVALGEVPTIDIPITIIARGVDN